MKFNQIRLRRINPYQALSIILAIILLIIIIFGIIILTPHLLILVKDLPRIRKLVYDAGILAPLVMVGLQAIQVLIAPTPGQLVAIVSGYIFGAFKGTILSMIGLTIGAIIAFLLARITGRRLLHYFLSTKTLSRLDSYILRKGTFLLFLLLIIPNPLGDGVYYLAGLTDFPLLIFIILVIICRLPSNIVNNIIGAKAGSFNFYHWVIFGIIILILILLYYLYRDRIEAILLRLANPSKANKSNKDRPPASPLCVFLLTLVVISLF
jgi:uncharacterized membrane protein YdjX (TVP38/TMEM64 family)